MAHTDEGSCGTQARSIDKSGRNEKGRRPVQRIATLYFVNIPVRLKMRCRQRNAVTRFLDP
jgi:hypothetical protein